MVQEKDKDRYRKAAINRRARFDYEILEVEEAGIQLTGTEVKSLRAGEANIAESYVELNGSELFLINSYIPEYSKANRFNHETRRPRKLLMHSSQIKKLGGKISTKGLTLIPLSIYFNKRGIAKVELALGRGKTKYDKRAAEKDREWQRDKARMMKEND